MKCVAVFLSAVALIGIAGCDQVMTSAPLAGDTFSSPMDELPGGLNAAFIQGDENFGRVFTVAEGLGPIFNSLSCEGCHPGDGRGTPQERFFASAGRVICSATRAGLNTRTSPFRVSLSKRCPPGSISLSGCRPRFLARG